MGMKNKIPGAATPVSQFFTITEVAKLLAVSSRTIRRAIDSKELAAHHFGKTVRIAESDIKAFIARHRRF